MFDAIVKDIRPRYGIGLSDCKGREAVTLELLVLGSLRFIATGCSFDMVEELTNVSNEKHRTFSGIISQNREFIRQSLL